MIQPAFERKLCPPGELAARVAQLPHPRVVTNGCFDSLHRGPVTDLAEAR
ncbi:MAG TPA: D-glycero-beta-D-manno-heptose 1-phosphate adenylyltransferase, partial [Thiobacillus sp.]